MDTGDAKKKGVQCIDFFFSPHCVMDKEVLVYSFLSYGIKIVKQAWMREQVIYLPQDLTRILAVHPYPHIWCLGPCNVMPQKLSEEHSSADLQSHRNDFYTSMGLVTVTAFRIIKGLNVTLVFLLGGD